MFFSSCAAVKYHAELLNYIDMPVKDIHGKQKQARPAFGVQPARARRSRAAPAATARAGSGWAA